MGEGGWMCVMGDGEGGGGGKGIKRKKEMGSGIYVYGGKKGGVEKKEKKNFEKEKTKLVLFVCSLVWCKV
jgi:hypothetical protein